MPHSGYLRTLISAATALFFLCLLLILRPVLDYRQETAGVEVRDFWKGKYNSTPTYDLVVGGDSRVYQGIAPEEMGLLGDKVRILNFGFAGTGFEQEYTSRLPSFLDPGGLQCIALSITPSSLTKLAMGKNGYLDAKRNHGAVEWTAEAWTTRLEPVNIVDVVIPLLPGSLQGSFNRVYSYYHPTGWVETKVTKPTVDGTVKAYEVFFEGNKVEADALERLISAVAGFRKQGIRVFGFRMPISSELLAVEDKSSGFEWPLFLQRFRGAGGIWLEGFEGEQFATYDGNHLMGDSARRFSRLLAREISVYTTGHR